MDKRIRKYKITTTFRGIYPLHTSKYLLKKSIKRWLIYVSKSAQCRAWLIESVGKEDMV